MKLVFQLHQALWGQRRIAGPLGDRSSAHAEDPGHLRLVDSQQGKRLLFRHRETISVLTKLVNNSNRNLCNFVLSLINMQTFGHRIQALRRELGYSQRKLGTLIGATGPTIFNWESDTTQPDRIRRSLLESAAEALNTTVDYLIWGKGDAHPDEPFSMQRVRAVDDTEYQDDDEGEVRIPVYDVRLQAGPGAQPPEFIETLERLTFKSSWLRKKRLREADLRIVTVEGDSMVPTLWGGDKVAVNINQRNVVDGRVFALAYGNDLRIKRLFWLADGRLRIVSDNKAYAEEIVNSEEIDRVVIIGQVMHKMGEGGL